jgi:hypothetical protein
MFINLDLVKSKTYNSILLKISFLMLLLLLLNGNLNGQTSYQYESRLTTSNGEINDRFGTSVSMDGFWAVIGAPGDAGENNLLSNQGAVHFYQYDINGWIEFQKIYSDAIAGQNFGEAVSMSGNTTIIGAPGILGETDTIPGRAYIYQNNDGDWTEIQEIIPETKSFYFGKSVDIDGDIIVIGVPATSITDTGSVYIYKNEGFDWEFQTRLTASDAYFGDQFGRSVSISGDRIIIGSDNEAAYIFRFDGIRWIEEQKLTITTEYENEDDFGRTVALHKNTAIVGRYFNDGVYYVYVFQYGDSTWIQQDVVHDASEEYGYTLAINDNMFAIGAYAESFTYNYSGEVFTYRFSGGEWIENRFKVGDLDESWEDNLYFGYSVDVSNSYVISGAPLRNTSTGAAYIHELSRRPDDVSVSNGTFHNRNKISWINDIGEATSGFRIYREHDVIDSTTNAASANYDYDGLAGKLHSYGVSAIANNWGESLPTYGLGWQPANGKLGGTVKTAYGSGVDSVAIEINSGDGQIGSCLVFDGINDYVIVDSFDDFSDDELTVSFWIKTVDQENTYPLSFYRIDYPNPFLIANPGNLSISITANYDYYEETGPTGISVNDGNWHHIAVTWLSTDGEISLLKDGKVVFSGMMQQGLLIRSFGSLMFGQNSIDQWGSVDTTHAFNGRLDEIRICFILDF